VLPVGAPLINVPRHSGSLLGNRPARRPRCSPEAGRRRHSRRRPARRPPARRHRCRGFEFTAAGQLSPSVKVLTGYVFADAVVTKDNVLPVKPEGAAIRVAGPLADRPRAATDAEPLPGALLRLVDRSGSD
jgi:hypothetical protein